MASLHARLHKRLRTSLHVALTRNRSTAPSETAPERRRQAPGAAQPELRLGLPSSPSRPVTSPSSSSEQHLGITSYSSSYRVKPPPTSPLPSGFHLSRPRHEGPGRVPTWAAETGPGPGGGGGCSQAAEQYKRGTPPRTHSASQLEMGAATMRARACSEG